MGGSVVTHTCPLLITEGYIISGIAVLDVVEGMFLYRLLSLVFFAMLYQFPMLSSIHN